MNNLEFSPVIEHILEVGEMTCGHCKMKVEKALNSISEIESAEVDLIEGTVEVKMRAEVEKEKLKNILDEIGHPLVGFLS